jgi:hypothetical protein
MRESAMRRFANLYIVLFFVDAGLSLVDELLKAFASPLSLLGEVRNLVAIIVIAMSVVVFACLGIDRRLPKRAFLPLIVYISWCSLALWPLIGLVGRDDLGLVAAVGQLLIGGCVFLLLRRPDGGVLLSAEAFRGVMFGWRNTLGFTVVNLLLLPFVLVFTLMAATSSYLDQQTAGFMRLSPLGIYMSERSYQRDGQMVRLAGMMHIGKEDYYQDLAGSMASARTIILAEGVTDRDKLLVNQFNYSKLAGVLGLSSQETMNLDANLVDLENLGALEPGEGGRDTPDIARADLDLNRFDPQTIEFLNVLGRTLLSGQPLAEGLLAYNAWADEHMSPERIAGMMADILDKRNAVVIDGMERSLAHYDTIIIPWGAMHMPAIEAAVLAQGFVPAASRERLSLDVRAIPYRELWRKWSAAQAER